MYLVFATRSKSFDLSQLCMINELANFVEKIVSLRNDE